MLQCLGDWERANLLCNALWIIEKAIHYNENNGSLQYHQYAAFFLTLLKRTSKSTERDKSHKALQHFISYNSLWWLLVNDVSDIHIYKE